MFYLHWKPKEQGGLHWTVMVRGDGSERVAEDRPVGRCARSELFLLEHLSQELCGVSCFIPKAWLPLVALPDWALACPLVQATLHSGVMRQYKQVSSPGLHGYDDAPFRDPGPGMSHYKPVIRGTEVIAVILRAEGAKDVKRPDNIESYRAFHFRTTEGMQ